MPDHGFKLLALPDELLLEILSFCSVEDIARLEMVSRSHRASAELSLNATRHADVLGPCVTLACCG